jgi:hypothetical protein
MDPGTPLEANRLDDIDTGHEAVAETVVDLDAPDRSVTIADAVLEAEPVPDRRPGGRDPHSVMEAAILSEGEGAEGVDAADDAASRTELAFDKPWAQLAHEKPAPGARFGADLRVVSVGTAERSGERGVRVPLVLGNDEGETLTVALTVQLDPLLEDEPG